MGAPDVAAAGERDDDYPDDGDDERTDHLAEDQDGQGGREQRPVLTVALLTLATTRSMALNEASRTTPVPTTPARTNRPTAVRVSPESIMLVLPTAAAASATAAASLTAAP